MGAVARMGRRTLVGLAAIAMAAGAATAAAPGASAADPQRVRVVSANVNFALDGPTVKERFQNYSRFADIVLIQEAKNLNLHTLLADDTWIVRQYRPQSGDTTAEIESKRGSAIVVRRSAVQSVDPLELRYGTDRTGGGSGCELMTRYVAHVRVVLTNGAVLRPASAHLPPGDCQAGPSGPYERMIANIKAMSDTYPDRLLVGGDWNKVVRSDPNDLGARTGGRIVPRGLPEDIDGFYKPAALPQDGDVAEVGFASSGHDAVQLVLTVPPTF